MFALFQRPAVRVWFIALALTTLMLFGLRHGYQQRGTSEELRKWDSQEKQVEAGASQLEGALAHRATRARELADALREELARGEDLEARRGLADEVLQRFSRADDGLIGAFLAPEGTSGYARCYRRDSEEPPALLWDASDRYLLSQGWLAPLADGEGWKTFVDSIDQTWVAQYAVPFFLPDAAGVERVAGLAFVRVDYSTLRDLVRTIDLGNTGYSFLMTESGELIDHPLLRERQVGVTLFELADRVRDDGLRETAELAVLGENSHIDREDPATGSRARIFFTPLSSSGWTLVGVSLWREVLGGDVLLRREKINLQFVSLLVVFCVVGLLAAAFFRDRERQLWACSIAASFLMIAAIVVLWRSAVMASGGTGEQLRIVDEGGLRTTLGRMQAQRDADAGGHADPLIAMPVGVFVQSLEFASANNVRLTGLVWTRIADDFPEDLDTGVLFPEAVELDSEEVFRRPYPSAENPRGEVVGTWFTATLRQNFQFLRYPFDTKDVWIRFWPRAFDRGVVLVPDLDAYSIRNPLAFPGLDSDFVLAGWKPVGSYFQYRTQRYNTSFGLEGYGAEAVHELYYTVDVRRNFVDSFVSDLIPLVVVACLLFGVLLTLTTEDKRFDATGFNFSAVLGACLALVFVVVVAHIQLRTMLAGQPIVYLEWFYFAMYIMVVAISLNGWLVVLPDPPFWIAYRDNLVPRILFWPLLLGALLAVTLSYFYPGTDQRSRDVPSAHASFLPVVPGLVDG